MFTRNVPANALAAAMNGDPEVLIAMCLGLHDEVLGRPELVDEFDAGKSPSCRNWRGRTGRHCSDLLPEEQLIEGPDAPGVLRVALHAEDTQIGRWRRKVWPERRERAHFTCMSAKQADRSTQSYAKSFPSRCRL